ncbi:MAG: radical SAM protein [Nitrospirae bacterium]|nr:radical SAM protein [Nitrospirota bacterium]
MNLDCLIIVPGIKSIVHRERFTTSYEFPRGALSLGSFLNYKGCKTAILPLDYYIESINIQSEIDSQIRSIITSAIKEYAPKVIGISVPYTMLYTSAIRIAEIVRETSEQSVIVLGGAHVSYLDMECFSDTKAVNVVVRGEGEWTLYELVMKVINNYGFSDILGITYKDHDKIIINPARGLGDMNELPVLDYRLLPEGFVRKMAVSIVTSRGCAYKCTYCNESLFWGNRVRRLSMDNIISEIKQLSLKYDNYPVGLEDSMFNLGSEQFYNLCERLKEVTLNPNIYLLSRVDSVTKQGLKIMREAGIKNLILGIESASPNVLKSMNKKITIDMARDACSLASNMGIIVGTFWIIGHPGDNIIESEKTINTISNFYKKGIMKSSEIALFIPYPGSDIFINPQKYDLEILTYEWEKWGRFNTEPICELKEFKKDDILYSWKMAQEADRLGKTVKQNIIDGKIGRNLPCPCGSGKKYKKCCGNG